MSAQRKPDNPFGLAPLPPLQDLQPSLGISLRREDMTRREKAISDEFRTQLLVQEYQKDKTRAGIQAITEIEEHAAVMFTETATNIWSVMEVKRSQGLQTYVDAFCHRGIQLAGRHIEEAASYGAMGIITEIKRPLYASPPPPPRPTFLQRLLGARDESSD